MREAQMDQESIKTDLLPNFMALQYAYCLQLIFYPDSPSEEKQTATQVAEQESELTQQWDSQPFCPKAPNVLPLLPKIKLLDDAWNTLSHTSLPGSQQGRDKFPLPSGIAFSSAPEIDFAVRHQRPPVLDNRNMNECLPPLPLLYK